MDQEDDMSMQSTRPSIIATLALTALTTIGSHLAVAETLAFRDIRKPAGHRHAAAARFDAQACGATKAFEVYNVVALEQCMLARGWATARKSTRAPASSSTVSETEASQRRLQESLDSERRMDDDIRHDDEMNATNAADAAQIANDASNAASAAAAMGN
jgi:hypothetical protein